MDNTTNAAATSNTIVTDTDSCGDEEEEKPWQGHKALEFRNATPPIPFDDVLEQFRKNPSTIADMERLNNFVESTLKTLARLEPIWQVEEGMEWSAYNATIKDRALATHPDEASINDLLSRLHITARDLHHACNRGVIRSLPGYVFHRAHEIACRIDDAHTIIAKCERSCGRHVRTETYEHVVNPLAEIEADVLATNKPSDEATQQAMKAFETFIAETGRRANGTPEQWEIKAYAVQTLEKAIRDTIAEVPETFVLFDKTANKLSTACVWYDHRTIPWTKLLSNNTRNPRNLGIIARTNQQMLHFLQCLVKKRLY